MSFGAQKHRKSGHVHNRKHFTGKKAKQGRIRRKGKTRKQRKLTHKSHKNRYTNH